MKITNLKIENFRAIKSLILDNLSNTVLIAGPNGCGKSCIFHAIRLLKSLVGKYQDNELNLWFQEFQIKPGNVHRDIVKIFQAEDKELKIEAQFKLNSAERDFFKKEGRFILEYNLWKASVPNFANNNQPPDSNQYQHYRSRPLGAQYNSLALQISKKSASEFENLKKDLLHEKFIVQVVIYKNGNITVSSPKILQLAFSIYEKDFGIIDYHDPHRNYQKMMLNNINLNIQANYQSMRNHALYNSQNKYNNIKQELAGDYIRKLIAEKSGDSTKSEDTNLIKTLEELFNEFFPGKKFLGPRPNKEGGIDFYVKLANGRIHDIDDLSSGEKEVLYGYLKLKNSAPQNSIILLDEPELHLNPRLISGLPQFYKNHLGDNLGNQILLITHSDTFLREAMKEKDYQVYHMKAPSKLSSKVENQIRIINANSALDMAIIDLVGAAYFPDQKIVLLEGEDSEFDSKMIKKLFPEFQESVNLISVGSKNQVKNLHNLLVAANQKRQLTTKVFSIVDKDLDDEIPDRLGGKFHWDVYHIENYLLDEDYLTESINGLILENSSLNDKEVLGLLIKCAKESVNNLIKHILEKTVYKETFQKIDLGFDPKNTNVSREIYDALKRSIDNISDIPNEAYLKKLKEIEERIREDFTQAFTDNSWKSKVRGKDVLARLVSELNIRFSGEKLSYKNLRNNVISIMENKKYKPNGMKEIIEQIQNA